FDEALRTKLALLFPSVELIAGIGLLIPTTRRVAAFVLIAMHVSLIVILGPWGIDHSRGVLIWNMMLMVQAWMLMIWKPSNAEQSTDVAASPTSESIARRVTSTTWFARLIVILAIAAPLLERSGYWDHWTSWSLYSPHTSRAEIELHRSVIGKIDPSVEQHMREDADGDGWHRLSLEDWSLADRFVPVYPQARYQLSLASHLAHANDWDSEIRVRLRGVSNRWSGERSDTRLLGKKQIDDELDRFWLSRSQR
ncbi:MAG: hypothetical protein ACR2NZ_00005, partial [Rubripirellula sp.]